MCTAGVSIPPTVLIIHFDTADPRPTTRHAQGAELHVRAKKGRGVEETARRIGAGYGAHCDWVGVLGSEAASSCEKRQGVGIPDALGTDGTDRVSRVRGLAQTPRAF